MIASRPWAAFALAALAAGCGQKLQSFLYSPTPESSYQLPAALQSFATAQTLTASDGTKVAAYYVAAPGPADRGVLYFHGNEANMDHYWDRVQILHDLGYPVLTFDYRGYGATPGKPTEPGLYEDARAAVEALHQRPELAHYCYYGWSLGAAIAYEMAVEAPPDALVSESAFASVQQIEDDGAGNLDLPGEWLTPDRYDNVGKIGAIDLPILLLHGEDDTFIRVNHALLLEAAAKAGKVPLTVWLIPGAGHSTIPTVGGQQYLNLVQATLGPPLSGP